MQFPYGFFIHFIKLPFGGIGRFAIGIAPVMGQQGRISRVKFRPCLMFQYIVGMPEFMCEDHCELFSA